MSSPMVVPSSIKAVFVLVKALQCVSYPEEIIAESSKSNRYTELNSTLIREDLDL